MILYLFLFYMLCFPISGNNSTLSKTEEINNKLSSPKELHTEVFNNTKSAMINEGGSLLSDIPALSFSKEKHTVLINLDKELGKNKEKSVVPRKGVVYNSSEVVALPETATQIDHDNVASNRMKNSSSTLATQKNNLVVDYAKISSTEKDEPVQSRNDSVVEDKKTIILNSSLLNNKNLFHKNGTSDIKSDNISRKAEVPKKPLILSYEALAKTASEDINDEIYFTSKNPNVKQSAVNKHPGMIMPIVITILVVPMFAVLGFMALKRGQEAWKNRHYKRMDFLLDGMYND